MKKHIIILISVTLLYAVIISTTTYASSEPTVQLPTNLVKMRAEYGVNSWFVMDIFEVPEGFDIVDGKYYGWCAQENVLMYRGVNHSVYLYSSYDPDMPQNFSSENWDKINYILNHDQGYDRESIQNAIWYYVDGLAYPSDPDAQTLINDTEENGEGFVPEPGETIVILVDGVEVQRSFLELPCPEPPSEPPPEEEEPPRNRAPTADASAGQPYVGFVDQQIIFNGSRSYDRDGHIVSYYWDFGDGSNGSGVISPHIYSQPGTYTVQLTVTDDDDAKDTHTVTANITSENYPPQAPIVTGPTSGHKYILYDFTAVSTDLENDLLQYIFNWGDGETTTSEFFSGTVIKTHSWSAAGRYSITVKAFDSITESGTTTFIIMIDAIYVDDLGYIIDIDGDGTYDYFHSNTTGTENQVEKSNDFYKIDTNGDGKWDYEYNPFIDKTIKLDEGASGSIFDNLPLIAIGVALVVIIIIIILIVFARKKQKL